MATRLRQKNFSQMMKVTLDNPITVGQALESDNQDTLWAAGATVYVADFDFSAKEVLAGDGRVWVWLPYNLVMTSKRK